MVAANAKVGVQTAAYFPDITISRPGRRPRGLSGRIACVEALNRFWSIGSNLSETLLDWGQRRAELRAD